MSKNTWYQRQLNSKYDKSRFWESVYIHVRQLRLSDGFVTVQHLHSYTYFQIQEQYHELAAYWLVLPYLVRYVLWTAQGFIRGLLRLCSRFFVREGCWSILEPHGKLILWRGGKWVYIRSRKCRNHTPGWRRTREQDQSKGSSKKAHSESKAKSILWKGSPTGKSRMFLPISVLLWRSPYGSSNSSVVLVIAFVIWSQVYGKLLTASFLSSQVLSSHEPTAGAAGDGFRDCRLSG